MSSAHASTSDLLALWRERVDGLDLGTVTDRLTELRSVRSASSRADIDALLAELDGSRREAALWWQLLCGWPFGFPPAAGLPVDAYPLGD